MRILLIEDDQELCHVLKISLEKAGYQTDICLTGTDALYYALQPVYNDHFRPHAAGDGWAVSFKTHKK